jgi:hypothetical protein
MDILVQLALTILSILAVLGLESLKKPRLRFSLGAPGEIFPDDPLGRKPAKWTHIYVRNEPMPSWLSWAWDRDPALSCHGSLSFTDQKGQDVFGRAMPIRWANNPEPLIQDPASGLPKGIDWDKMRVGHLWDIAPAPISHMEYGVADVAFRADGESDAYGWNNDAYLHDWRNPQWRLPPGNYTVRIAVRTGGQVFRDTFRLINDTPYAQFRLEQPSARS